MSEPLSWTLMSLVSHHFTCLLYLNLWNVVALTFKFLLILLHMHSCVKEDRLASLK